MQYIGRILDGVVEKRDNKTLVHTSNYIPVVINNNVLDNEIVKVKINEVEGLVVKGELVK